MSLLDQLIESTRTRIRELEAQVTPEVLEQRIASLDPPLGFRRSLEAPGIQIIAEIKRVSPSAGPLNPTLNATDLAHGYARGGAAAISVLTEPSLFQGTREDLEAARTAGLPVLRKDFVLAELQVLETRAWGADAVLLVVRTLGEELPRLITLARALGIDALVEVHDAPEMDRALEAGADLVGVNNRDLETFEVDPERTAKLVDMAPAEVLVAGLSGVSRRADVEALEACGAKAALVGEALVTAADPAAKLRELRGAT